MNISVEPATNDADIEAILQIRDEVFFREMGISLEPLEASRNGQATYLLARVGPDRQAVGSLCVLDTSDNKELHESLGLKFRSPAQVARYTHLAVLKPYRGRHIPLAMMLEAHRSVIVPRQFDYTWLLFDVERAANSFLSRQLGFTLLPQTFVSEYGCRCPLVRNEHSHEAARAIRQAERYLRSCESVNALAGSPPAPIALSV